MRHQLGADRDSRGEEWSKEETHDADDDCVGNDVGHPPEDDLQDHTSEGVQHDHALLAESECRLSEEESSKCCATIVCGADIADLGKVASSHFNQIFNDPTSHSKCCTYVEKKESAQQPDRLLFQCCFELRPRHPASSLSSRR